MSTKERPIIFSGPMVRAILDGNKTQTRRVLKPQPVDLQYGPGAEPWDASTGYALRCPYGNLGDLLWVRETWGLFNDLGFCDTSLAGLKKLPYHWQLSYRADHIDPEKGDGPHQPVWRPSIYMPRWASRITLEITGIRVERLQQISEADAIAEGCPLVNPDQFIPGYGGSSASGWFSQLWEDINGNGSWDVNPWVWVIEFRLKESQV